MAYNNPRPVPSRNCGCQGCLAKYPDSTVKPSKRHTGSWQLRYRDLAGKQRAENRRLKSEALARLEEVRTTVRVGTWVNPQASRMTLADFHDLWMATRKIEASTARAEATRWGIISDRWGGVPLAAITHLDVQAWVASMPYAPWTIRHVLHMFRAHTRAAVRDRRIPFDPLEGVVTPRIRERPRDDQRPPSNDEFAAIAQNIADHYRALLIVADETGLRWGELIGLRRCWVNLEDDFVAVREVIARGKEGPARKPYPKTSAGAREVPLSPLAHNALVEHLAQHPAAPTKSDPSSGMCSDELVFRSLKQRPLRDSYFVRVVWHPACRDAGLLRELPKVGTQQRYWPNFHLLRHRFQSRLENGGVPESLRKELIGHARPKDVTWRYTHASSELREQVMKALRGEWSLRLTESTDSPHTSSHVA